MWQRGTVVVIGSSEALSAHAWLHLVDNEIPWTETPKNTFPHDGKVTTNHAILLLGDANASDEMKQITVKKMELMKKKIYASIMDKLTTKQLLGSLPRNRKQLGQVHSETLDLSSNVELSEKIDCINTEDGAKRLKMPRGSICYLLMRR